MDTPVEPETSVTTSKEEEEPAEEANGAELEPSSSAADDSKADESGAELEEDPGVSNEEVADPLEQQQRKPPLEAQAEIPLQGPAHGWETPTQEPVNGVVQPPVIPPIGKPTRHTNQLDFISKEVLKAAKNHKHAWPFMKPVDTVKLGIPVSP